MFRKELPRVYELRDLIQDTNLAGAYFKDFDNSIRDEPSKKRVWLEREQAFQQLDVVAWTFLKDKARSYLTTQNLKGRGWHQLIDTLNEAYAYNFLREKGCSSVRFIPPSSLLKKPDLQAEQSGRKVLCEVKTINISEDEAFMRKEAFARREGTAMAIIDPKTGRPDLKIINKLLRTIEDQLGEGFFRKLKSDIEDAEEQMKAYDDGTNIRRIVFIIVNFDDFLGEYKERYYLQIDQYLAKNPPRDAEVVFYNQRTPFHKPIAMTSATVIQ